jgi:transcriptional regulator with XRE-family HTH domain
MEKKRVTLKDVAKEAGVSTATVSYVLNYSEKEKISHDTRMKIFDAARRLKYVPNMTARSLASQRSYLVGIIINMEDKNKRSKIYEYYDLANELQRKLHPKGYDVVFLPTKDLEKDIEVSQKRSLDAVFIVDMDEATFKVIAHHFYVPAIFIDGYIEDPIFCKVLSDYEMILEQTKEQFGNHFFVVIEDYHNKRIMDNFYKELPEENIFVNRYDNNMIQFLQEHQNQKILVIGEMLGMQVENYIDNRNLIVVVASEGDSLLLPDTKKIVVSNKMKAAKAVDIMEKLLHIENADKVERVAYIKPI